jgi:hypothetical protein
MTDREVRSLRLRNQHLTGPPLGSAEEAVGRLGAVQAQDYGGAKWAVAQRCRGATDAGIDALFAGGTILRTHVMRPTWHFVAPDDVRWIQELTAPRVHAANAYYYRKLELDDATFARSNAALAKALRDDNHLTRVELAQVLQGIGIAASGPRLAYLVMRAELDGIVCSGGRRGKQFTYALLDERAPNARRLPREEALAELAGRYFTSHGPALIQDYVWWSGLTVADAQAGVELARPRLDRDVIGGKTFWFASPDALSEEVALVHLLPNYDEYLIGHRDHGLTFDAAVLPDGVTIESVLGGHILVVDGMIVGGWRRAVDGGEVVVEVNCLIPLDALAKDALATAVDRYGGFLGMPATLAVRS